MEARVADIAAGRAPELVWLLEHPSLYTSGTSGKPPTCSTPAFRSLTADVAGSSPITAPASAWLM